MSKASEAGGASPKITVINHEARWTRIPIQFVGERFKRLKPEQRTTHNKIVSLKPGANSIDLALWKQIRGEREEGDDRESVDLVEKLIEAGTIQEVQRPIHSMPVGEAVAIVNLTIDVPILLGVQAKDKRSGVQKAVLKQLEALKGDAHTQQQTG